MYVPVPPAPPAVGVGAPKAEPAELGPAIPKARWLSSSASPLRANLAVTSSTLDVLQGHAATITGTLRPRNGNAALAGRIVALQTFSGGGWDTVAIARTGKRGVFHVRLVPRRMGTERVRLRFAGDQYLLAAKRPLGRLSVYRSVVASWYGGGGSLACGGSLTSSTMGVANRTLPCGTLVTLRVGWRTVSVPVVDRGPFVEGREFDLTEATKQALGFGDTGEVWSTR
jgi:peptidoglycan lytic transglycosylase